MDVILGVYHGLLQGDVYSILFAVFVLVMVIALFRAAFSLVIVAILSCIVLVSVFEYSPQEIRYAVETQTKKIKTRLLKETTPLLTEGLKDADVTYDENHYSIVVNGIKIDGKKGDTQILLNFMGEKLTLDMKDYPRDIQALLTDFAEGVPPSTDN